MAWAMVATHQASHRGRLRSGGIDALGGEQVGEERPGLDAVAAPET